MSTTSTPVQPRFQCRHVFTSGHRCGSPALRQEHFCYYHNNTRKPAPQRHIAAGHRDAFVLPNPEDRSAIQSAIGQVLLRLAANDLTRVAPASSSTASRSPPFTSRPPKNPQIPGKL